ncbi:MAG: hypothetical protein IT370_26970 [Deltaproteobacteria bacterium]|nr:hypothetical protein [Deltaproteobacteria bacterium]
MMRPHWLGLVVLVACGCGGGGDGDAGDGGAGADTGLARDAGAGDGAVSGDGGAATDARVVDGGARDGGAPVPLLRETFTTAAAAWPAPWVVAGGVAAHSVVGGRGRLLPTLSSYALARMHVPAAVVDAEARYKVRFTEPGLMGAGFYLRQNGGWLQGTATHGQGYAAFLEGFRGPRLGVWREVDGVEMEIAFTTFPTLAANVDYQLRFTVTQEGSMTRLHAEVTRPDMPALPAVVVDALDGTAILQNRAGAIAVDAYSNQNVGGTVGEVLFDDIEVDAR